MLGQWLIMVPTRDMRDHTCIRSNVDLTTHSLPGVQARTHTHKHRQMLAGGVVVWAPPWSICCPVRRWGWGEGEPLRKLSQYRSCPPAGGGVCVTVGGEALYRDLNSNLDFANLVLTLASSDLVPFSPEQVVWDSAKQTHKHGDVL